MPIYSDDPLVSLKQSHKKGNLYIKFDIKFPKQLEEETKVEFAQVLAA
jgi:DnaJ-class molecular chaperone